MLRLNDWAGRLVLIFYGVGTTVVAILSVDGFLFPILAVASLFYLWAGLAILARSDTEPFSLLGTLVVVGIVGVVAAISCWNVVNPSDPGYSTWYLGAMTFLLLVLALRGRRGWAWIGFLVLSSITVLGAALADQEVLLSIMFIVRQAAILLIGTLFALVLRRASQTITSIQNSQLARATQAATISAASRERDAQNARLERDARPALERIRTGVPLSAEELHSLVLLESTLRDGIRAVGLSSDRLARATREARDRGLRVVLLDDRGAELSAEQRVAVESAIIDQFESTHDGSVTARLSPHDRDELATIVVEQGGAYRRVVVGADDVEVTYL
jgi:type II secretory pathway pseudopilin PulG